MQVDLTLMNVGDGGTVSRQISAPIKASASMVGNPPQTLPSEFRGDVTLSQQNKTAPTTDCKTAKACLDTSNYNHTPELSPPQQPNNASTPGSDKRADKRAEPPKPKSDGVAVLPAPQWSSVVKVSREDSLSPGRGALTPSKKPHPPAPSAQSAPPGFQCAAKFKPAQPVAFLPSKNVPSPHCKITPPPALGAAFREAPAGQLQKELEPQGSGVGGTPLTRTYPYPFSVGRTPAAEKKAGAASSKLKSNHSSNKHSKSVGEHISLASAAASPAVVLPLRPSLTPAAPSRYTLSPTAAICCGSALASIASQSRLLKHAEKSNSLDKTTGGSPKTTPPVSASGDNAPRPVDVPLDLSARSKRPKCIDDPLVTTSEPHSNNSEPNQREFLNSKRARSTTYSSAAQYPVLPNTHRNGSHQKHSDRPQNHQVQEPKAAWGKGASQDSIKSIPGTYVGVASPILASTLRGKDGKGTFVDEFQSFAKQEFISIIDQGEHLASGGKKPSCVTTKGNQHAHSVEHVKTPSVAITTDCPSKGAPSSAARAQAHQKMPAVVGAAWQQQPPSAPQPAPPAQRKAPQGSPKTKGASATERCKARSPHRGGPSSPEEDKRERMKCPLSNLASIVKQQALLDAAARAGEGESLASAAASRKAGVANPRPPSQDARAKPPSAFEYPTYWALEKWAGLPPQADCTPAKKKPETAKEPVENNAVELNASRGEMMGAPAKQSFPKPAGRLFGKASTNGNRLESKLAQVLEGESDSPARERPGGAVAFEQKTNGTKEESPSEAAAAGVGQKKSSPKKPAKEKSPPDSSKKKKQDAEKSPTKGSCQKKKTQCAPVQEQSLSPSKGSIPRDKTSPNKVQQAARDKSVPESGGGAPEAPGPLDGCAVTAKEADATGSCTPRLRRGRRRADEARLDLWGFATPSPPPPQMPPPPVSPSPPAIPSQPARRPRGRPRSTRLPERALRGKAKAAGAEDDAPAAKKRRRCRSKKYQTGDYITEKDKLEDAERREEADSLRRDSDVPADSQAHRCSSPTARSPEPPPRRPSFTRSGSLRYQESEESPESSDKPSGKRKFKSKHLSDSEEQKTKTKRSGSGKRAAPLAVDNEGADAKRTQSLPPAPKGLPSSPPGKKGSAGRMGGPESPAKRPVPPEVRRLIVNKNAGETLLQRAARLGYQDVVQYCLEKDGGEVNRRDNAGYTALHEASSRGWTQIVQMLLKHAADVNCSAQDGTRPLHDAVASDNLPIVWLLLNHGADPTLATYSGHTPVKLAHSPSMKTFLTEYFTDLEARKEQDLGSPWDFYSSSLFETDQEPCWDFLLSEQNRELPQDSTGKTEPDSDKDCLLFEFSSEPLLPCYHVQVSLTQGFCNWFLLTDVLRRLKMSARIFRARYPHLEVVSLSRVELSRQASISQVSCTLAPLYKGKNEEEEEEEEQEEEDQQEAGIVELVRCIPELQRLLGSSIDILQDDDEEEEEEEETLTNAGRPRSR
ncbi:uncharacterized protein bcorl1 isoform 2-T11 [Spinachia spinachia]